MLIALIALSRCIFAKESLAQRFAVSIAGTQTRQFSTPRLHDAANDEVKVKVQIGLKKQVNLAVQQPPKPENRAPIILYLHHGISNQFLRASSTIELATGANAIVVRLDYRVSEEEPYPFAIHSVLAGYDWIRTHLLPSRCNAKSSSQISERDAPCVGVCGELVGGSLATMLALTECRGGRIGAVKAAAVSNPIVDWTALAMSEEEMQTGLNSQGREQSSPQVSTNDKSYKSLPSRKSLLSLRSQYFRKPEKYFDAFASPLLFFRTPRYAVPGPRIITMDLAEAEYASPDPEPEPELVKKRLSHRTYPPAGSGLILPKMRLEVGDESVLRGQGIEMVDLWRRSQTRQRDSVPSAKENSIEDVVRKGSGLWGQGHLGEVGRWLGRALRD